VFTLNSFKGFELKMKKIVCATNLELNIVTSEILAACGCIRGVTTHF
jgi:hypothetical protein